MTGNVLKLLLITVFLSLVVTLLIETLKEKLVFSMILANIVGSTVAVISSEVICPSLRVTCEELKTIWLASSPSVSLFTLNAITISVETAFCVFTVKAILISSPPIPFAS